MNLVVNHWKSGGANADEYRRAIETQRMAQVVARMAADTPFVLMGDVNADVRDGAPTPSVFTAEPTADLPTDFVTGADIRAQFLSGGLPNDPFPTLANLARMLDAQQVDGNYATRPSSGRRLVEIRGMADGLGRIQALILLGIYQRKAEDPFLVRQVPTWH